MVKEEGGCDLDERPHKLSDAEHATEPGARGIKPSAKCIKKISRRRAEERVL
jgi:hypothetical protein